MKSRNAVVISVMAVFVLMSSYAIAGTSVSDATSSSDFENYYYSQLTADQQTIYKELYLLTQSADNIKEPSAGQNCYYVEYVAAGSYTNYDNAFESVSRAWEALKLTEPFAWITWGFDHAATCIHLEEGTTYTFMIYVCPEYIAGCSDLAAVKEKIGNMVQESKDALTKLISDLKLSAENSKVDSIKAINNYICSDSIVYDSKATYGSCIYGALVAVDSDGHHAILCEGYAALVQALCNALSIPCLTVYGLVTTVTSSDYHAWNIVMVGSGSDWHAYGYDATFDDTGDDSDAYLLVGSQTVIGSYTFGMTHQAFTFYDDWESGSAHKPYSFYSYAIETDGYDWPQETSIYEIIQDYAPWIVVGIISALLAYVLWSIGKKGELNGR